MTECNKSTGSHSHTKPLRKSFPQSAQFHCGLEEERFHFCKKNQFGHLCKMEKRKEEGESFQGGLILGDYCFVLRNEEFG